MDVPELARHLKTDEARLGAIIAGQQDLTADIALRLGHWFETSAEFWLNLQKAYELRLAEEVAGEEIATLPVRPRAAAGKTEPDMPCDDPQEWEAVLDADPNLRAVWDDFTAQLDEDAALIGQGVRPTDQALHKAARRVMDVADVDPKSPAND